MGCGQRYGKFILAQPEYLLNVRNRQGRLARRFILLNGLLNGHIYTSGRTGSNQSKTLCLPKTIAAPMGTKRTCRIPSTFTFPFPQRLNLHHSLTHYSFNNIALSSSHSSSNSISLLQPGPTLPTAKCNSHYRRRSSVSTRRESAEVMGVAFPTQSESR